MFSASNSHFSAKIISRTALVIAMTSVINQIHVFMLPQGGEVSLGTMIPLILLSYCFGWRITLLAGFICGIIALMINPYFYHPVQVLLDYPLPYMAMAVVGLFKQRILLGTTVAYALKYVFHIISGVVFFASYAPEGTPALVYSLVYNGSFVIPDWLICCLILHFLPIERIVHAMRDESL